MGTMHQQCKHTFNSFNYIFLTLVHCFETSVGHNTIFGSQGFRTLAVPRHCTGEGIVRFKDFKVALRSFRRTAI